MASHSARFAQGINELTDGTDVVLRLPEVGATYPRHRRSCHFAACGLFDALHDFVDLETRIAALPTQQDRGDAFEVFAEAYLATQKLLGAEAVWPADQVPISVLESCSLPLKDMGADGVYKTWAAGLQCVSVEVPHGATITEVAGTVDLYGSD